MFGACFRMLAVILVSDFMLLICFKYRNKRLAVTHGPVLYIYMYTVYSVALTIIFMILKLNLGSILKRNSHLEALFYFLFDLIF